MLGRSDRIVSASTDGTLRVWEIPKEGERQPRSLSGHTAAVTCVAYSPDGRLLATGGADGTVRLWDPTTGKELCRYDWEGRIWDVAFRIWNGTELLAVCNNGACRRWRLPDQLVPAVGKTTDPKDPPRRILSQAGSGGSVIDFSIFPDGKKVAALGVYKASYAIPVLDVGTGEVIRSSSRDSEVNRLQVSPDGRHILSATGKGALTLLDAETGDVVRRFQGHQALIRGMSFSKDGSRLATCAGVNTLKGPPLDCTVRIWDPATAKELRRLTFKSIVMCVAISPDGKRVLAGFNEDKTLHLFDVATGKEIGRLAGHTYDVSSVVFLPDNQRAVSAGDGTIRLWDLQKLREIHQFTGHQGTVWDICLSADGRRMLSSCDKTLRYWDVDSAKEMRKIEENHGRHVVLTPDGKMGLWTGSEGLVLYQLTKD